MFGAQSCLVMSQVNGSFRKMRFLGLAFTLFIYLFVYIIIYLLATCLFNLFTYYLLASCLFYYLLFIY